MPRDVKLPAWRKNRKRRAYLALYYNKIAPMYGAIYIEDDNLNYPFVGSGSLAATTVPFMRSS